jgi:hypothetical protein
LHHEHRAHRSSKTEEREFIYRDQTPCKAKIDTIQPPNRRLMSVTNSITLMTKIGFQLSTVTKKADGN